MLRWRYGALKAAKQTQHLYLVAKIDEVEVAYSASQNVGLEFRDSFHLNIKATIENIPENLNGIIASPSLCPLAASAVLQAIL
ncbi:hypothetical protein [Sphingorhabdus sp. YGSMI21]|uniref:hypothetical protein n=1 Tax=Sphingorhabdus sp. YGSMI21 TaxID=2077182 RepID=UPI000F4F3F88|nr:hypothetical protein [Sphingorhabdus sp. YGSMI21]